MQKKFDNYAQIPVIETADTLSEGTFSVNATLSSLQEIIILYLKELAFFASRLDKMGIRDSSIRDMVIISLFNLTTNAEYKQNEFSSTISNLYDEINKLRDVYYEKCNERGIEPERLKTYFKIGKFFTLSDAIRKGEKYSLKKSLAYTQEQKDFFDIMFILLKSIAIRIIETHRLGKDCEECFWGAIDLLDAMNFYNYSVENAKKRIEDAIKIYHTSFKLLHETQKELYGEIQKREVSFSTRPGKAILVSGSDFKKLENILEATKGLDIDVYTHGIEMLMANAFPKFREYPHLVGHYGFGLESSMIDFATFPGAIIMTKGTIQRVEFLYRGRLFTLDPIPPMGVVRLGTKALTPLINAAQTSRGFAKGQTRPPLNVGYDEKELEQKITEIIKKVLAGEIKHLFIVGLVNFPNQNRAYFEEFFDKFPDDCFAISLCCPVIADNIFHMKSFYDYSYIDRILSKIEDIAPLKDLPISVYVTRCDKHTVSNLLYLKYKGIKNIFMCKCSPNLINPSIIKSIQKIYNINDFTNPESDIKKALS